MIHKYTYNWIWIGFITIITGLVLWFCVSDILTVTNPSGLRIVSIVPNGERTIYSLDCGALVLQFSAVSTINLSVGDYMPALDQFHTTMNNALALSIILGSVVFLCYLTELFSIPDIIRKQIAKKGMMINGEVKSFEHFFLCFYTVKVDGNGTTYKMRYPLTKRECQKYPKGTPAVIWNGGRKRRWIELQKQ